MRALAVLLLLVPLAPAAPGEASRNRALGLVAQYKRAKSWALKGMVLLSFGKKWHPEASRIVTSALEDRDKRLRAYALELLGRTDGDVVRRTADRALVDALVAAQRTTNDYFGDRAREVLATIAPAAAARTKREWILWWRKVGESYEPLPWKEPDGPARKTTKRTVAHPFLKRGFDLQESGLELVIVIDSTGSMQPAIDQARDAVESVVDVLGAVAPEFRLGLVTYRDDEDPALRGSTRVLARLTRNARGVRARLSSLRADGGGDAPERVSHGLEQALERRMGWSRDAAKLVVLVGDAPAKDRNRAVELARRAHEEPGALLGLTGGDPVKPFVVSAIGASSLSRPYFARIVEAGGGAYAEISRLNRGQARRASRIVRHILVLAFGKRWKDQVGAFLRVYDRYKRRGYIR